MEGCTGCGEDNTTQGWCMDMACRPMFMSIPYGMCVRCFVTCRSGLSKRGQRHFYFWWCSSSTES
jgi:hypothetical protein